MDSQCNWLYNEIQSFIHTDFEVVYQFFWNWCQNSIGVHDAWQHYDFLACILIWLIKIIMTCVPLLVSFFFFNVLCSHAFNSSCKLFCQQYTIIRLLCSFSYTITFQIILNIFFFYTYPYPLINDMFDISPSKYIYFLCIVYDKCYVISCCFS